MWFIGFFDQSRYCYSLAVGLFNFRIFANNDNKLANPFLLTFLLWSHKNKPIDIFAV